MRAIVLSAGQGKRLLPLTASEPKCLLPVDGDRGVLELQLRAIAACGIDRATILVGFGADRVEHLIATQRIPGIEVDAIYNPVYATTDNLITCWMAREAMDGDFLLLNGDTLFEDDVLRTVLEGPRSPITVTINHKPDYDDDDMKVTVDDDGRLRAIGKKIPRTEVNGESIGMLLFRDEGVRAWREALDHSVRRPDALNAWYLSVVDEMSRSMRVDTTAITGMWWQEIDSPEDLKAAQQGFRNVGSEPDRPTPLVARASTL
jgi:choline kinase